MPQSLDLAISQEPDRFVRLIHQEDRNIKDLDDFKNAFINLKKYLSEKINL